MSIIKRAVWIMLVYTICYCIFFIVNEIVKFFRVVEFKLYIAIITSVFFTAIIVGLGTFYDIKATKSIDKKRTWHYLCIRLEIILIVEGGFFLLIYYFALSTNIPFVKIFNDIPFFQPIFFFCVLCCIEILAFYRTICYAKQINEMKMIAKQMLEDGEDQETIMKTTKLTLKELTEVINKDNLKL